MNRSKPLLLAVLLLFLPLLGCRNDPIPPDNLLAEDLYTELLLETFMASYLIEMEDLQEKSDSVYNSLYDSYGVTKARFDSSHTWYNRHPQSQIERVEEIRERLADEIRELNQAVNESAP